MSVTDRMPTTAEVAEFVRSHFAAKAAADRETLAAQFVPDLAWWVPLSAARHGLVERPIRGAERIVELISSDIMYERQAREWTVHDLVTDGAKVAVRASLRARVTATGQPYENDYTFFMRLEGLKIAEVWEAFDSAYVLERLAASPGNAR
jgi:ketosteroid isomerase-like protein